MSCIHYLLFFDLPLFFLVFEDSFLFDPNVRPKREKRRWIGRKKIDPVSFERNRDRLFVMDLPECRDPFFARDFDNEEKSKETLHFVGQEDLQWLMGKSPVSATP